MGGWKVQACMLEMGIDVCKIPLSLTSFPSEKPCIFENSPAHLFSVEISCSWTTLSSEVPVYAEVALLSHGSCSPV